MEETVSSDRGADVTRDESRQVETSHGTAGQCFGSRPKPKIMMLSIFCRDALQLVDHTLLMSRNEKLSVKQSVVVVGLELKYVVDCMLP